ncbi:MAG: protease modulator HflC [Hyphomicrobiales bacterium]|nr:protease modulator HflC [Hyphomicrobiales bacterium]
MSRMPIILVLVAILAYLGLNSLFVVNEREQAIVTRFGEIQRVEPEPGLYFKWPLALFELENVQIVEDRLIRLDLNDIRVQVSGGKFYNVDAYLVYKISDPKLFRERTSGSLIIAENRVQSSFNSALRRVYGLRDFKAALSVARAEMMTEVRDQVRPKASALGLEIVDVRIRRTDLTNEVSQQTFERMKAERQAEAERLRARGKEAARRIQARADREVIEIEAAAQRDGEILRGQGEAERNGIFADAFNRDPEFFEFYRSMAAYGEALKDGSTTMVLSPKSDFFRFFRDPNGKK